MKRESLIAYAVNFVSFLLDTDIAPKIHKIILFGSVARGIYDEESDIDVFIDTREDLEEEIKKILVLFQNSEVQKKWGLKGIKSDISIKVGELNKWKLKRDIISDGIILYGKFKEIPESVEYYLLITPSFRKFNKSNKVKIWRKLYGYRQNVGNKIYKREGLLEKFGGKRIENSMLIKMANKREIIAFLNKEKISYKVTEIWSDNMPSPTTK